VSGEREIATLIERAEPGRSQLLTAHMWQPLSLSMLLIHAAPLRYNDFLPVAQATYSSKVAWLAYSTSTTLPNFSIVSSAASYPLSLSLSS